MAANMMKRAIRSGMEADYVLADAWFGTKPMIRTALELEVCAILRMKKGKMKYRAVVHGRTKQLLNAQELYAYAVKREWFRRVETLNGRTARSLNLAVRESVGKYRRQPRFTLS